MTPPRLAAACLLLLATLACYLPALRGGFVWDDDRHVSNNRPLRSLRGLQQIWFNRYATPQYYPMTHTTFWIEYRFWGLNSTGYHVTNVLFHGTNAILVWLLLRKLQVPAAYLAAAIFAMHPVHVESVAWISERKNVLATCFFLLSMLAYLRMGALGYGLSLVLFICALLSKTITCSMPAVMVLLLWWKGRLTVRQIILLAPFFLIGLALGLATAHMERTFVGARGPDYDLSLLQRTLIASHAVWFYIGKLVWPLKLTFSYARWEMNTQNALLYIAPAAILVVLGALAAATRRLGRGPLVAMLIFIGTLFPALGFFDVFPMRFSFVADHFQYLSSIAMIGLLSAALTWAFARWVDLAGMQAARGQVAMAASAVLLVVLGALTWLQASAYRDPETLWRDTIRKNPSSWMAYNNLGAGLLASAEAELLDGRDAPAQRKLLEAIGLFERCEELRPTNYKAKTSRARALALLGREPQAIRVFEEVAALMEQLLAESPRDAEARANYGNVLERLGRYEQARAQFEEALRINPNAHVARMGLERLDKAQATTGPASAPATQP